MSLLFSAELGAKWVGNPLANCMMATVTKHDRKNFTKIQNLVN